MRRVMRKGTLWQKVKFFKASDWNRIWKRRVWNWKAVRRLTKTAPSAYERNLVATYTCASCIVEISRICPRHMYTSRQYCTCRVKILHTASRYSMLKLEKNQYLNFNLDLICYNTKLFLNFFTRYIFFFLIWKNTIENKKFHFLNKICEIWNKQWHTKSFFEMKSTIVFLFGRIGRKCDLPQEKGPNAENIDFLFLILIEKWFFPLSQINYFNHVIY